MRESLSEVLIRHEGLRLKPYKCSARKLTIGVGRNIEDRGISEDEAMLMLRNDIAVSHTEAKSFAWYGGLCDVRKNVVISMIFNLGLPRFKLFKLMIAALECGDYEVAACEMLDSKWARQVGNRAVELSGMMRAGR
jgi:lysozyme